MVNENPGPPPVADTLWQCAECKVWHPVQSMARACEAKHDE